MGLILLDLSDCYSFESFKKQYRAITATSPNKAHISHNDIHWHSIKEIDKRRLQQVVPQVKWEKLR